MDQGCHLFWDIASQGITWQLAYAWKAELIILTTLTITTTIGTQAFAILPLGSLFPHLKRPNEKRKSADISSPKAVS